MNIELADEDGARPMTAEMFEKALTEAWWHGADAMLGEVVAALDAVPQQGRCRPADIKQEITNRRKTLKHEKLEDSGELAEIAKAARIALDNLANIRLSLQATVALAEKIAEIAG